MREKPDTMTIKRPLVWISAALVGGTAFSSAFGLPFIPLAVAFVSSWLLALILSVLRRRTAAAAALVTASFLLGTCTYLLAAYAREIPDTLAQHYASDTSARAVLRGTVSGCRISPDGRRIAFVLDVERIETQIGDLSVDARAPGRTRVSWYEPDALLESGDVVRVTGKLKILRGFKNPGAFDYERHMHRLGIFTTLYANGPDALTIEGKGELGQLQRLKHSVRREGLRILAEATRTEETRAFLSAILIGERSLLTDEMEEWFKRTGTFHILAISGLHVGLVYLIVSLALTPLGLGVKGRVAASIAVVWAYALVTGGSVSVVRASIMLTLVLAGYYLSREGDFLTSVACAALLLVGFDPLIIDDLGFQLSFTAVLLLCTFEPLYTEKFYPLIRDRLQRIPSPILNRLAITIFASLVVGIGMLPLIAYHFNMVSFVFPITNLLVIPVLSFALAAGFACLLAGFLWIEAAVVLGLIAEAFSWTIFGFVKLCSFIPGGWARVASPPPWVLGLEALAIVLVWWRPLSVRKLAPFAAVAVIMIVTSFSTRSRTDLLSVTFLDVGDADSCLVEFPSGETMLVDTGFATSGLDCGEDLIAPFLWKKGIHAIDTLVLTHPDTDHTGGALFLVNSFRIGQLWAPETEETPPEFAEIFAALDAQERPIRKMRAGDSPLNVGGVHIEILNPPAAVARELLSDNDLSLVLRMRYDETCLLLGGDAGRQAFRFMIASGKDVRSAILKAPHHGLKSGFDREFVERVRPDLVVISGKTHRVNQTMRDRVERYAPLCETVYCTKDCGAITIQTNGRKITVTSARKARRELF